ncbi:MAG: CPBP family intramembrane metalloprotease [Treponema sp.]|nr:CPBP family intramembrane metalloprotease [Treponema sp.]MCL2272137.1 CPBP family intramembrane metalloprotease [Treponema sp.]
MKKLINWKLFFILLALSVMASVLVIPYQLAITSIQIKVSPLLVVLSAILNSLIIFAVAVFFGLFFSKKIGMGMPILEGILQKVNKTKEFKLMLPLSIGLGVFAGILIIALSIPFNRLIPEFQNMEVLAPVWKGFLASFYGGIAEEVLLRLFIVSLLVWITFKIKKSKDGNPTIFGIWLSIILVAILFGIGHLPATAQIAKLTVIVITRAVVLNGIGGVIFGWLYWKKGLESAIIAHFSADIVLHVITPFIISLI